MKAANAEIVVFSAEKPEVSRDLAAKQNITYPIVQDVNLAIARSFGIAFALPDDVIECLSRLRHRPAEEHGYDGLGTADARSLRHRQVGHRPFGGGGSRLHGSARACGNARGRARTEVIHGRDAIDAGAGHAVSGPCACAASCTELCRVDAQTYSRSASGKKDRDECDARQATSRHDQAGSKSTMLRAANSLVVPCRR